MNWPFVTRKVYRLELASRDCQIESLAAHRDELARRLDLLTDQLLAKNGLITAPTMRKVHVPKAAGAASMIVGALGITEVEMGERAPHQS